MNSWEGIGRLTKDPEMKETAAQHTAVALFTVAIDENKDHTDFIRVEVYGRQAENCGKYLHKGSQVGINGKITTGSWKDKDGNTVYFTVVTAFRVEFIGSSNKPAENGEKAASNTPPCDVGYDGEPIDEDFETLDEDVPF